MKLVLSFRTLWIASCIIFSVSVSTEDVASSRTNILGFANIARANEISCFSPVDSRLPPSPTSES